MHLLCFGGNFVWYANVHHYLKLDVRAFTPKTEKLSTAHVLYLNFFFLQFAIVFFSLFLQSLSSLCLSSLSPCRSWFTVVDHGSQRCFRSSFSGSEPIWFSVVGFRGWSNPIGFLGLLAVAGEQRSWMVLGVFQASRSFQNRITSEVTRTL